MLIKGRIILKRGIACLLIAMILFTVSACSSRGINQEHKEYVEGFGWTIESFENEDTIMLNLYPETLESYHASNIYFLDDHSGTEVNISNYTLKQRDDGGEPIRVTIYEKDNKILGAIGVLPSWTPGLFNIKDQTQLMIEGLLIQ